MERIGAFMARHPWMFVVPLAVVTVLVIGVGIFNYSVTNSAVDENQEQAVRDLRESQYVNCIRSGNALRRQVRREFIDLKTDVLIPVFSQVATQIPKGAKTRRILTGSVAYMHKRIRTINYRIPNVDCANRYPPLPGQSFGPIRPQRNGA